MPPSDPLSQAGTALLRHPLALMLVAAAASALVTYGASRVELGTQDRRLSTLEAQAAAQVARDQAQDAKANAQEVRLATLETQQQGQQRVLDTELAGFRRELELMRHALEKLAEQRTSRTASYR